MGFEFCKMKIIEKKHQILTSNNAVKETYILRKVLRCKFNLTL